MQLVYLYTAIHDITATLGDGTGAPGGKRFWSEVKARLLDYAQHIESGTPWFKADHGPIDKPDLASRASFNGLNRAYAQDAAEAINKFAWSETGEKSTLWQPIYSYLNLLYRREDGEVSFRYGYDTKGTYLSFFSEHTQMKAVEFERPAFTLTPWYRPGQYVHHNPEDRTMVRYIPKGKTPVPKNFVTAKPGKYLTTYFSDILSSTQIAEYAAKHRAEGQPPTLLIARTADEISMVYRLGPTSCMAAGKGAISGIEPIRAYASPDLGVAYLMRAGKPTARVVVRPDKNAYGRIYGDFATLTPALRTAGFINAAWGAEQEPIRNKQLFDGARLCVQPAPGFIPAHLHYEKRGEPVSIAPFWDLKHAAYFDPDDGYLHLAPDTTTKFPEGPAHRAKHTLRGGFSLPAIPTSGPTLISNYEGNYIEVTIGSSGQNTKTHIPIAGTGREPQRNAMKDNAEAALHEKKKRLYEAALRQRDIGQPEARRVLDGLMPIGRGLF